MMRGNSVAIVLNCAMRRGPGHLGPFHLDLAGPEGHSNNDGIDRPMSQSTFSSLVGVLGEIKT